MLISDIESCLIVFVDRDVPGIEGDIAWSDNTSSSLSSSAYNARPQDDILLGVQLWNNSRANIIHLPKDARHTISPNVINLLVFIAYEAEVLATKERLPSLVVTTRA